jgi:hypothetical protein
VEGAGRSAFVLTWLVQTPVAVEKGTKAVIPVNFSLFGRLTFNHLRTNFAVEIPEKEFFISYACFEQCKGRTESSRIGRGR